MNSSMKAFSIISITVLLFATQKVAKASDESLDFVTATGVCLGETGATASDIFHFIAGNLPETREQKCLAACVGKKSGILTADNIIDEQYIMAYSELSVTRDVAAACKDAAEHADECEATNDILKCVFSKADKSGISFISTFLVKNGH